MSISPHLIDAATLVGFMFIGFCIGLYVGVYLVERRISREQSNEGKENRDNRR